MARPPPSGISFLLCQQLLKDGLRLASAALESVACPARCRDSINVCRSKFMSKFLMIKSQTLKSKIRARGHKAHREGKAALSCKYLQRGELQVPSGRSAWWPLGAGWQGPGAGTSPPRSRAQPWLDPGWKPCVRRTWTSIPKTAGNPSRSFRGIGLQWDQGERGVALSDKIQRPMRKDEIAKGSRPGTRKGRKAALQDPGREHVCRGVSAMNSVCEHETPCGHTQELADSQR